MAGYEIPGWRFCTASGLHRAFKEPTNTSGPLANIAEGWTLLRSWGPAHSHAAQWSPSSNDLLVCMHIGAGWRCTSSLVEHRHRIRWSYSGFGLIRPVCCRGADSSTVQRDMLNQCRRERFGVIDSWIVEGDEQESTKYRGLHKMSRAETLAIVPAGKILVEGPPSPQDSRSVGGPLALARHCGPIVCTG